MHLIATFHTHFGAMSFQKKIERLGRNVGMMPVPRALSASCGVCVRFEGPFDPSMATDDLEAVYEDAPNGYALLFEQPEN